MRNTPEPKTGRLSVARSLLIFLMVFVATAAIGVWRFPQFLPWLTSVQASMSDKPATAVAVALPPTRIVRVSPANVRQIDHLRMSTEELLDDKFALFDSQLLTLTPPRRMLDEIERDFMFAELTNKSPDYVALDAVMKLSIFNGATDLKMRSAWPLPDRIYPGDRVPIRLNGQDSSRYTEVKVDWLPMKRAALPGPRAKLELNVENTEAGIGTGTLNFTYRYRYKYVTVHGRVRNTDEIDIQDVKVWVSLYDGQDKLTGAEFKELRLPRLKPGESAPFEVHVKQFGANFAKVGLVYDTNSR